MSIPIRPIRIILSLTVMVLLFGVHPKASNANQNTGFMTYLPLIVAPRERLAFTAAKSVVSPLPWGLFILYDDGSSGVRVPACCSSNIKENYLGGWAWSPDGSKMAFAFRDTVGINIYTAKADGTGRTTLTQNSGFNDHPSWSPDSTRIAFSYTPDVNTDEQVFLMNADGSQVVQLTHCDRDCRSPKWSPDGARIAFWNGAEIAIMQADGSGQTNLTNNNSNLFSWSPDGSKLLFESALGLFTLNVISPTVVSTLASDLVWRAADWSNDGNKVVFTEDISATRKTYIANPDGSERIELLCQGERIKAYSLSWSSNGTKIAFTSAVPSLFILNPDGSDCHAISSGWTAVGSVSWSPGW